MTRRLDAGMRLRFAPIASLGVGVVSLGCGTNMEVVTPPKEGGVTDATSDSPSVDVGQGANDAGNAAARCDAGDGAARCDAGDAAALSDAGDGAAPCGGQEGGCSAPATYDQTVLRDRPVAYWAMSNPPSEPDLTGGGNTGTYLGGSPALSTLPNGDKVVVFNGSSEYLTVPSNASMSIPTTGELTWEGWVRPDVLQFPHDDGKEGFVDWLGKCEQYSPTCEWEARLYDTTTKVVPNRCNRFSAYVFNPDAGLGSGADWQPVCGLVAAGKWYHVVGEYSTRSQPADCPSVPAYPGSIDIWVNGVDWSQPNHSPTGCMSQYSVLPRANDSAVLIGSMALDTWFQGAIGKIAIYGYLLSPEQIAGHYQAMTGQQPSGSCADTCTL